MSWSALKLYGRAAVSVSVIMNPVRGRGRSFKKIVIKI